MPLTLLSYEADIRAGGGYRLVFDVDGTNRMEFFGKYLEVTPHSPDRLDRMTKVARMEPSRPVTLFEEKAGKTCCWVLHEASIRSKEVRDAAFASGAYDGMGETFGQLDEVLVTLVAKGGAS